MTYVKRAWKSILMKREAWLVFDGLEIFYMIYVRYLDGCWRYRTIGAKKSQFHAMYGTRHMGKGAAAGQLRACVILLVLRYMDVFLMMNDTCLKHKSNGRVWSRQILCFEVLMHNMASFGDFKNDL